MNRRVVGLLMALAVVAGADGGAGAATSKRVAQVEGALSANDLTPDQGESIYLYFNATPLRDVPTFTLTLQLPEGLEPADAAETAKTFSQVKAGQTLTLALKVTNTHTTEQIVLGSATMVETEALHLSRAFILHLNAEPKTPPAVRRGRSKDGKPLAIYGGQSDKPTEQKIIDKKTEKNMPQQVMLETSKGNILIEMNAAATDVTVENFLRYVKEGFYDGTIFHRVIPDFMIQGGGFADDMKEKGTQKPIVNESADAPPNMRGTLAMARTNNPDSATCQFFINVKDNAFLNHQPGRPGYAVFAKVIEGMDVVDAIVSVKTANKGSHQNVPVEPVVLTSAKIVETP